MLSSLGHFGDARLAKGALLLERLCTVGAHGISLDLLGGDAAGAVQFRRLLNNPRVTTVEMTATARADLLHRVSGRHVLAIQDSTSLRDDGKRQNLYLPRPLRWMPLTARCWAC